MPLPVITLISTHVDIHANEKELALIAIPHVALVMTCHKSKLDLHFTATLHSLC